MIKWILPVWLACSAITAWAQSADVPISEPEAVAVEATAVVEPAEPAPVDAIPAEAPVEAAEAPVETAAAPAAEEEPPPPAPTFVVLVPERIDHDWYWLLYSDTSQHIVQSAIERSLIRNGLNVIVPDIATLPAFGQDWQRLQSIAFALTAGKQLEADYVISGMATAVKSSEGQAYGVTVVRTQAEINAKIVRVRDGKIVAAEEASAMEGGQSAQAAGQNALKKAGAQIGSKLARAARALAEENKSGAP